MVASAQQDLRLVRRPRPARTESGLAFILKVSEKNGYLTPQAVLARAGIARNRLHTTDAMAKLGHITGLTPAELLSVGTHWGETERMFCRLLGHRIHSADLQFKQRKVCPECVKEKGFIEAHFDLAVMIACPVHGKLMVTHCSQCAAEVRWERPGLLKCPCGEDLTRCDDSSVPPAVRQLLDIVRRKALHLELGADDSSGLPVAELWRLTLRSLVYLIRVLGRNVVGGRDVVKLNDFGRIVPSAAEALANWPNGFHQRLQELTAGIPEDVPLRLNALPLGGIYSSLGCGVIPRSDAKFLIHPLSSFVVNHLGSGSHDPEFRTEKSEYAKRYVSVSRCAEMWGIGSQTAAHLIKSYGLPTVEVPRGGSIRTYLDLTKVALPKIYRLDVAAKAIGMSPRILSKLKDSGDFKVNHLPQGMLAIHQSDLSGFTGQLVSKALQQIVNQDEAQRSVRFECIMQSEFWTAEEKTDIVRHLLDGSLEACGCKDGTLGGILVPVSAIANSRSRGLRGRTQFLFQDGPSAARGVAAEAVLCAGFATGEDEAGGEALDVPLEWAEEQLTVRPGERSEIADVRGTAKLGADAVHQMNTAEAASYLKCSRPTVLTLLGEGHIQGVKHGNRWLIDNNVLRKFGTTYVQLALVADELRTNSRTIARYCEVHDVPMLSPGRGGKSGGQTFIRLEDKPMPDALFTYLLDLRIRQWGLAA